MSIMKKGLLHLMVLAFLALVPVGSNVFAAQTQPQYATSNGQVQVEQTWWHGGGGGWRGGWGGHRNYWYPYPYYRPYYNYYYNYYRPYNYPYYYYY